MKYPEITIVRESIWKRDLLDSRFGFTLRRWVIPPAMIAVGIGLALASPSLLPLVWFLNPLLYLGFAAAAMGVGLCSTRMVRTESETGIRNRRRVAFLMLCAIFLFMALFLLSDFATGVFGWGHKNEANKAVEVTPDGAPHF